MLVELSVKALWPGHALQCRHWMQRWRTAVSHSWGVSAHFSRPCNLRNLFRDPNRPGQRHRDDPSHPPPNACPQQLARPATAARRATIGSEDLQQRFAAQERVRVGKRGLEEPYSATGAGDGAMEHSMITTRAARSPRRPCEPHSPLLPPLPHAALAARCWCRPRRSARTPQPTPTTGAARRTTTGASGLPRPRASGGPASASTTTSGARSTRGQGVGGLGGARAPAHRLAPHGPRAHSLRLLHAAGGAAGRRTCARPMTRRCGMATATD